MFLREGVVFGRGHVVAGEAAHALFPVLARRSLISAAELLLVLPRHFKAADSRCVLC